MPPEVVKLEPIPTPYETASAKIILDVVVGEAQKGRIKVSLDGEEKTKASEIKGLEIGDNASLIGKTLQVLTTVTVMNPNSGRTVVTYTLSGGKEKKTHTSNGPNGAVGDTANFQAKFLFK